MFIEVWQIILFGIATAFTLWVGEWAKNLSKTKRQRRYEESKTGAAEIDVELKRISADTVKDETTREAITSAYVWIDQLNEKLNDFRADLMKAEEKIFLLTKRAVKAERERDFYKSLIWKIINAIKKACPKFDTKVYEDVIEIDDVP